MKTITDQRTSLPLFLGMIGGFFSLSLIALPALGLSEKAKEVQIPLPGGEKESEVRYCGDSPCSEDFKKELAKAVAGDPEAQNKVGESLHFARGVKQDYGEALKWYLKASAKKHAEAANHIGRIYLNGEGVVRNEREACAWYIKSAEWGHVWGMINAASCLKHGHGGFAKSEAKSAEWYAKAEVAQPGVYKQYQEMLKVNGKATKKPN